MSTETAWACRYEVEWGEDGVLVTRQHLVVVWAVDPDDAREKSGLVFEPFHEATDEEMDEWELIVDDPLDERELEQLATMVAKQSRHVGRRRLKNRQRGRTSGMRLERDGDRKWAGHLAVLFGKIEARAKETEVKAA